MELLIVAGGGGGRSVKMLKGLRSRNIATGGLGPAGSGTSAVISDPVTHNGSQKNDFMAQRPGIRN
jgi:hypothetical protein